MEGERYMQQNQNQAKKWKITAIIAIILLIAVSALFAKEILRKKSDQENFRQQVQTQQSAEVQKTAQKETAVQPVTETPQQEADTEETLTESPQQEAGTEETLTESPQQEAGTEETLTEPSQQEADTNGTQTEEPARMEEEKQTESEQAEEALSLWTEDSAARTELISYVKAVTEEGSADFIPEKDRIAVFDLDGTLFCETDPNYFDYCLLVYRVLEDPDYKDQATEFEREVAGKIVTQNETGESFKGLEVDHGKAVASAFSGMTIDEFNAYIQEFKKQPMPGYDGMARGEGFYQPMLQVVDYLEESGFTVYIVSGTDRFIVRGIAQGTLDLPLSQIIGSDESVVARDQGDVNGLDYVFDDDDVLVLGGDFLIKNLKMNKVAVIMQEIGQQPVLSFGNSTGDSSMAEYVTSGNPYRSLAFMLCCDDVERENGNVEKADKMYRLCEEFDWIPVSMKNDWTTIYAEGVTRK